MDSFALLRSWVAEVELEAVRFEKCVRQHGVHLGHRHELERLSNLFRDLVEIGRGEMPFLREHGVVGNGDEEESVIQPAIERGRTP